MGMSIVNIKVGTLYIQNKVITLIKNNLSKIKYEIQTHKRK